MIYLDSNIFIHSIIGNDEKSNVCSNILIKIIKGETDACTSILTWDEFFYALKKEIGKLNALEESKAFLSMPNLVFSEATSQVITKAHDLISHYNLGPRDAIHAASAILNGCKEIMSDDPDFDKIKEIKRIKP